MVMHSAFCKISCFTMDSACCRIVAFQQCIKPMYTYSAFLVSARAFGGVTVSLGYRRHSPQFFFFRSKFPSHDSRFEKRVIRHPPSPGWFSTLSLSPLLVIDRRSSLLAFAIKMISFLQDRSYLRASSSGQK